MESRVEEDDKMDIGNKREGLERESYIFWANLKSM